ncbi:MAG: hypothetical protein QOF58_6268 [Pseudonocardiales bacterium]|jgi:hypothetical protein|nr:hypothetical protein [Pseudonocardiales bacterium]
MTDVFINYRGADSNYAARLLFEGLKPRFGRQVFFDEETIQPGEDYVLRLLRGVRESTVLLAVIGPQWLITDASGNRRIDDEDDWIRRELVAAYQGDVRVIPVFTDGAKPEDLEPLPPDIARLRTSQGMQLRRQRADEDVARISDEVARHVPARRRRAVAIVVALVALLLVGAGVGLSFLVRGNEREPAATSSTPGPSSVIETTTTTSAAPRTTTAQPPEPQELWEGTVNLDFETYQVSFALDWAPPQRTLGGDIGLCNEFVCSSPGSAIAGKAFAAWTGEGLPERAECAELLKKTAGEPTLPVRVGTKACLATEGKRIGRLEVVEIGGPGKIKIHVKVWDLPAR